MLSIILYHLLLALMPVGIGHLLLMNSENTEAKLGTTLVVAVVFGLIAVLVAVVSPIAFALSVTTFTLFFVSLILYFVAQAMVGETDTLLQCLGTVALYIVLVSVNSVVFRYETISNRLDVTQVEESFLVNPDHPRIIVSNNAIELAKKTMGQSLARFDDVILGSMYQIDHTRANIDIVNGETIWVIPLDFRKLWGQNKVDNIIPAIITVSATSLDTNATLRTKNKQGEEYDIKYSSGAWWGHQLERYIRSNYASYIIADTKIRLDDDYNPHAISYVVEPSTLYKNYEPVGIIDIDLQTGEHAYHTLDEAKTALPWMEILMPLELTLEMLNDWGSYKTGGFAPMFNASAIIKATTFDGGNDMAFIGSTFGNIWWTGMTSASSSDDSLASILGVNTMTGEAYNYRFKNGSGGDEDAAVKAVKSVLGVNSDKWTPRRPIPYNIFDKHPTYVIPVVDNTTGMFVGLGLVNMRHTTQVIYQKGKNIQAALRAYLKVVQTSDQVNITADDLTAIQGIVDAYNLIVRENTAYAYISIDGDNRIFECNADEIVKCFKINKGQNVKFQVFDNKEQKLSIEEF